MIHWLTGSDNSANIQEYQGLKYKWNINVSDIRNTVFYKKLFQVRVYYRCFSFVFSCYLILFTYTSTLVRFFDEE